MKSLKKETIKTNVFLLIIIFVAVGWFLLNFTLDPQYRGRICCDSVHYIELANRIDELQFVLSHYEYRTLGYPIFLALVRSVVQMLHFQNAVDWVNVSLFFSFILHICSSFFFYRSITVTGTKLSKIALVILIIHPGLVSYAAIPLTDSFTTSLLMVLAGCFMRISHKENYKLDWALAIIVGLIAGWIVLSRQLHLFAFFMLAISWVLLAIYLTVKHKKYLFLLPPFIAIIVGALVLSPRVAACFRVSQKVCLISQADEAEQINISMSMHFGGPRTYSYLSPKEISLRTVQDKFFYSHFQCLKNQVTVSGILSCYSQNITNLPLYFTKKAIELFNNHHLNAYAAFVTKPWQMYYNRIFGLMAFIGFGNILLTGILAIPKKLPKFNFALIWIYLVTYFAISLIPHVESRYGFPLVPFALFSFVYTIQYMVKSRFRNQWLNIFFVSLAVAFILETTLQDQYDPLFSASKTNNSYHKNASHIGVILVHPHQGNTPSNMPAPPAA